MAKFTPRLTAPSKTDKRLIYYENGGISIVPPVDKKTGLEIPNCVGYFHFRWLELLGCTKTNWKIPGCNAEDCYDKAIANGFKVGTEPKLGAGIVWRAGKTHNSADGCGHIGVVEEIKANGDIVVSQSAFQGQEFYLTTLTKASGYSYSPDRIFVGFIYIGIEYDTDTAATPKAVGYLDTATFGNGKLTVSGWAYKGAGSQKVTIKVYKGSTVVTSYTLTANKSRPDVKSVMKYSTDKVGYSDTKSLALADGTYTIKAYVGADQLTNSKTITVKNPLTATSYPNYPKGKSYKVMTKVNNWSTSKGTFQLFKNAYNQWNKYKSAGYHIYDNDWKQLD